MNKTKYPEWIETGGGELDKLYEVYDKWLHIKDKGRIDIGLAVSLSTQMKGTPIWLFIVGPSGDGKSEQVMALNNSNVEILHEITAQTLVSGFSNHEDLAPRLDGKLVIIPDMAQLLNLHPNEKSKVWAQLRELYDGRAGRETGVSSTKYDGLRISLIGCSTPSIDNQILIFTHLGTRELVYRTSEGNCDKLLEKVLENEENEEEMRKELKESTEAFLRTHTIRDIKPPEKIIKKMKGMVQYLRFMRAHGDVDGYTGELRNFVYPEQPTRCLKQFKRIFVALKSLDENYTDERALAVISHITKSSILPLREKIFFSLFSAEDWISTSKVAEYTKIGKKTAMAQLQILWNMDLIDRQSDTFSGGNVEVFQWKMAQKGRGLVKWLKEV